MSLYLYDQALLNKIKGWANNANLTITGPEETQRLFEVTLDKQRDSNIKLPLLCITRNRGYRIIDKGKKPLTYDGLMLNSSIEKSISLNAIPIEIPYYIDIYTRYLREADEYMRNIIFNVINFPKLSIEIPYEGIGREHQSNIHLIGDVEDKSDIPTRLGIGQFSRLSVGISIDDAYLFDSRVRDNLSIDVEVEA